MKSTLVGIVIGGAVALYLSMLYLYSLWLPVTSIAVLISGLVGRAFSKPVKPAMITALVLLIAYFSVFWIPPEMAIRTANTPEKHFNAARAIGSRAQIFGDQTRELEQYRLAMQGGHPEATYVLAAYNDFGYNGHLRDESKAIEYYARAAELGYHDEHDRLGQLTKKQRQNKAEEPTPNPPFE